MSPTTTTTAAPAVTYSTAGTVSSPLDLDDVKGEHQSVNVDANGGSKRRVVSPKVKATLTSLTINNVSPYPSRAAGMQEIGLRPSPSVITWTSERLELEFEYEF